MPWNSLPVVEVCCGCVTDLKTAAAIIAVLGIVTSPSLSWAVVRHSYVIRVSCYATTTASRPDIIDINLHNIMSFGFGANAGLGPSCLGSSKNNNSMQMLENSEEDESSNFVNTIKYIGWIVLAVDLIFIWSSVMFLHRIFNGSSAKAAKIFLWSCCMSVFCSFVYATLFIVACMSIGGAFPIFEFIFSIFDVLLWIMWIYFAFIIYCYINRDTYIVIGPVNQSMWEKILEYFYPRVTLCDKIYEYLSTFR